MKRDNAGLFNQLNTEDVPTVIKNLTIEIGAKGIIGQQGNTGAITSKVNKDESNVTIINCHVLGNIESTNTVGGFIGRVEGPLEIINCSFQGIVSATSEADGLAGGLVGQKYEGGTTFKMTGSYTIDSDISSAGSNVGGLIGVAGPNSIVEACYASGGTVIGKNNVGGLIGNYYTNRDGALRSFSFMKNCFSTNSVGCSDNTAGGLVGSININTDNPHPDATAADRAFAFDIIECYSTGSIGAVNGPIGGLVGIYNKSNECLIDACYSVATLTAGSTIGGLIGNTAGCQSLTITNSYALSSPFSGDYDLGRLIGKVTPNEGTNTITVTDCFAFDGLSSIAENSAAATLLTKEQVIQSAFSAWDFTDMWSWGNGMYNLPVLQELDLDGQPSESTPTHLKQLTSLANTQQNITFIYKDNAIQVNGAEGIVTITNVSGISQVYTANGFLNIPVNAPGIYILSINNSSYKISVK